MHAADVALSIAAREMGVVSHEYKPMGRNFPLGRSRGKHVPSRFEPPFRSGGAPFSVQSVDVPSYATMLADDFARQCGVGTVDDL